MLERLIKDGALIESVAYVIEAVNEGRHEKVKSWAVKEAMKDYGLRFHKINCIPMNRNKPRSLVL